MGGNRMIMRLKIATILEILKMLRLIKVKHLQLLKLATLNLKHCLNLPQSKVYAPGFGTIFDNPKRG
jgi:hypothetical protein